MRLLLTMTLLAGCSLDPIVDRVEDAFTVPGDPCTLELRASCRADAPTPVACDEACAGDEACCGALATADRRFTQAECLIDGGPTCEPDVELVTCTAECWELQGLCTGDGTQCLELGLMCRTACNEAAR